MTTIAYKDGVIAYDGRQVRNDRIVSDNAPKCLIGLPADTVPDVYPGFIQSILHDQLRYTMHRDVLRLDQAAWDAVQDFPQHKMSALDYDQAVDRQISRWRQIQHQAEMQRLALEKAEADQVEEATKQQDDPAHQWRHQRPS